MLNYNVTGMHSSRMRTARSSSRPGGVPGRDQAAPGTRHPPCGQTHTCQHITLPQASFASGYKYLSAFYDVIKAVTAKTKKESAYHELSSYRNYWIGIQGRIKDFLEEGAPTQNGGHQPIIWPNFPKNCMKIKISPRGGTRPKFCYVDTPLELMKRFCGQ